jgi:hypothetical protein
VEIVSELIDFIDFGAEEKLFTDIDQRPTLFLCTWLRPSAHLIIHITYIKKKDLEGIRLN